MNDPYSTRLEVEAEEKWRSWQQNIPAIHFPQEWAVKIIPPFAGAMIRFFVEYNGKQVSVYLDCYGRLGAVDEPYWEVYPYDGDVFRCMMDEVNQLLEAIQYSLGAPSPS